MKVIVHILHKQSLSKEERLKLWEKVKDCLDCMFAVLQIWRKEPIWFTVEEPVYAAGNITSASLEAIRKVDEENRYDWSIFLAPFDVPKPNTKTKHGAWCWYNRGIVFSSYQPENIVAGLKSSLLHELLHMLDLMPSEIP